MTTKVMGLRVTIFFTLWTLGIAKTPPFANATTPLPAEGNGTVYASACSSAWESYSSASSAWDSEHMTVETTTYTDDGLDVRVYTYYESATTLCDGKARVRTSPAVPLSSRTTTLRTGPSTEEVYTETVGHGLFSDLRPSCSIKPGDCDVLWQDYSRSAAMPQITPPPHTPPCYNSSMAARQSSFDSSFSGCGRCTIFGDKVQLVYFPVPTTVSRDMCATTPSAKLTHYGSGAVITAYAGTAYSGMNNSVTGQKTAVVNGHTFTSGTAYISIASVWAEDRCFSHYGTTVHNAILAMPSESVLSLRYTQDHFQYFYDISTQTGYPVSYADFNEPVPYSAWNGQNICRAADDGWSCQTIYEGMYRPQLAIPPGIKRLSPDFADCQGWYNGLFDPPLALTEAASEAAPTLPAHHYPSSATAMPSSTVAAPTSDPTMPPKSNGVPQAQGEILEPSGTSHVPEHHSGSWSSNGHSGSHSDADHSNSGLDEGVETLSWDPSSSAYHDSPQAEQDSDNGTPMEDGAPWHASPTEASPTADMPNSRMGDEDEDQESAAQTGEEVPSATSEGEASGQSDNEQDANLSDGISEPNLDNSPTHTPASQSSDHADVGGYVHHGVASWQEHTSAVVADEAQTSASDAGSNSSTDEAAGEGGMENNSSTQTAQPENTYQRDQSFLSSLANASKAAGQQATATSTMTRKPFDAQSSSASAAGDSTVNADALAASSIRSGISNSSTNVAALRRLSSFTLAVVLLVSCFAIYS